MTQPNDGQKTAHDAAAYAVLLSRFESHAAQFQEFRSEFQRFAERNGERISTLELSHQHLSTLIDLIRDELKILKDENKADREDRRRLSERTGNLETAMSDLQEIKRMLTGSIIGLVATIVVFGSLFAYVLLRP